MRGGAPAVHSEYWMGVGRLRGQGSVPQPMGDVLHARSRPDNRRWTAQGEAQTHLRSDEAAGALRGR